MKIQESHNNKENKIKKNSKVHRKKNHYLKI